MSALAIGVLVPVDRGEAAPPPEARPMGRAALLLEQEGLAVIFGDQLAHGRISGVRARPGRWEPVDDQVVAALHDRYPSQVRAHQHGALIAAAGALPVGNPVIITDLCRDKLACQRVLEAAGLPLPEVVDDPTAFALHLDRWGAAFAKPRYGALGLGVRRLKAGDPVPERLSGVVPTTLEPTLLQRAVPPPEGWAGRALRVLCQRLPGGGWLACEPVLRQSRADPVVNAARGAEVRVAGDALPAAVVEQACATAIRAAWCLAGSPGGGLSVEFGVDLVLDPQGQAWLIEVNSRPRGRLAVLAALAPDRFISAHVQACARPIRALASLPPIRGGVSAQALPSSPIASTGQFSFASLHPANSSLFSGCL